MDQEALFHDDWRDALCHLVKALGGWETAGADLFPNKTRKAAGSWLYDCLHAERPAKLDLDDIQGLLRLGRDRGIHVGMSQLCDEVGYERPQASSPKSPKAKLLEQQAAAMAEAARIQREIDRLDGAAELRAVRGK